MNVVRWWRRQDDRRKVVIGIVAVVLVLWAVTFTRNVTSEPSTGPATAGYVSQYGGSEQAYAEIAAESDCSTLQAVFDRAGDNNDAAEPGTAEHRWTLGYMTAALERMERVGCS